MGEKRVKRISFRIKEDYSLLSLKYGTKNVTKLFHTLKKIPFNAKQKIKERFFGKSRKETKM